MNWIFCFSLACFVFGAGSAVSAEKKIPTILGSWVTEDSASIVKIRSCSRSVCGDIVWLKEPNDKQGIPWTDTQNPKTDLQARPILGLTILSGLNEDGPGIWKNGKIYDPNSGNTYACRAILVSEDKLELRGYVLNPLFGRSEMWVRVVSEPGKRIP